MKDTTKATILLHLSEMLEKEIDATKEATDKMLYYQNRAQNDFMLIAAQAVVRATTRYNLLEETYNEIQKILTEEN